MFKRSLKVLLIIVGSLVGILVLSYVVIYSISTYRLSQVYTFDQLPLQIPNDSASILAGQHIASIRGCEDCHAKDFGGKIIKSGPEFGMLAGPNLTNGIGGIGASLTDGDWVRAIKHGVNKEHRTLLLMPANEYFQLSNTDIQNLVAYMKTVPPVDRKIPAAKAGPLLRILYTIGKFPNLAPAELITDHAGKATLAYTPGISEQNGRYLITSCTGCHGDSLKGKDFGIPGIKASVDITSTGNVGKWTEEQFIRALRTGQTPQGRQLDPKDMPWTMTANFTDDELRSLYQFLHRLP